MSLLALSGTNSVSGGGYEIDNSVKLQTAGVNSEFFNKAYSSASNRQTWTYSTWLKITEIGVNNYFLDAWKNGNTFFILGVSDVGRLVFYDIVAGTDYGKQTDRLLRDTSAWYHVVFVSDTTNGTPADRYRLYVNGVRETSFNIDYGDVPQNYNGSVNDSITHSIGYRTDGNTSFNGYLAETILVDGQALNPTDFGEFDSNSGIWKPIEITDTSFTWGTNGLWLKYDNASSMGANSAATGGFSVQNVNQNDQATDTPTNNFATGNNLVKFSNPSSTVVTDGATFLEKGANGWETISGTIYVTRGKWYCEVQSILNSNTTAMCSVMPDDSPLIGVGGQISNYAGKVSGDGGVSYYANNGYKYLDGGNSTYGDSWTSGAGLGDIMGIALDMDNGKVYFAKANTWQNSGDPTSGATGTGAIDLPFPTKAYTMAAAIYANNNSIAINYGGYTYITISSAASDANGYGTFEYAPPSGYYALCTKNLAEYG